MKYRWHNLGWEFALSLLHSLLFLSKSLIIRSDNERFAHVALYKRATVSDSLMSLFTKEQCEWFTSDLNRLLIKNERFAQNILIFRFANRSRCSSLICSFLKSDLGDLNCSHHSLQKSDREQFAQVAHYKRAVGAIHSFSRANRSFAHKKQANRLKNQWANSQPWTQLFFKYTSPRRW